jgi:hypothetical protein
MRATLCLLGGLLLALTLTPSAPAWHDYAPHPANAFSPICCPPYWGGAYAGSYTPWPPGFQPYQGVQANVPFNAGCGITYPRSPRDYFMVNP